VTATQARPREPDLRFGPGDNWSITWRREHRRFAEELDRYEREHPEDSDWIAEMRRRHG
jgi:hypothetical protein